ncbi:MAG: hypothetical protein DMD81_23090 [Candidatus Rokuibacteriota bacterium]|nr:MAG: hypothetical protein DMD81_23090 [Candidatus Rokubacteria bacterium]
MGCDVAAPASDRPERAPRTDRDDDVAERFRQTGLVRPRRDRGSDRVAFVLVEIASHAEDTQKAQRARRPQGAGLAVPRAGPACPGRRGERFDRRESGRSEGGVELETVLDPLVVRRR